MSAPVVYPTNDDLCQVLKGLTRARKVSQRRLSELAGIPLSTLQRKLNGGSRIFVHDIIAIAGALEADFPGIIVEAEELAGSRAAL